MNTNQIRLESGFPVAGPEVCAKATGGLRAWALGRLEALRRHQQRRRAISELARMSDWRLADLGIPREQIREVVDGMIAREGPSARCASK
jgi:uncharacterized protein YjiS (DUF1127 family)